MGPKSGTRMLACLAAALATASPVAADDEIGVEVGQRLPITSMRALLATEDREKNTGLKEVDGNTCFAGRHLNHTTVTVLARNAAPPALELVSSLDQLLP